MSRFAAFLVAFFCQLAPSIALAWSLGARDIGQVTLDSVPGVVLPSHVIFGGAFSGLLSSIGFGCLVAAYAPGAYYRRPELNAVIVLAFIICSLFSMQFVSRWFQQSYGSTWLPWEAFFELGVGSAITLPVYLGGFLAAHVLLQRLYKRKSIVKCSSEQNLP